MNGIGPRGGGTVPSTSASQNNICLKVLLSGEEVKYLFGAEEILLNQLKQQTLTNISLSEPGPHERVLTIPGQLEAVFKAFGLVCRKLWEFVVSLSDPTNPRMLVVRLAVPSSQCGMIIGKQGAKINEIRDLTGANINVSQDYLPESNERTVEMIGTGDSCLQSAYHVCTILQENPPRGENMPYTPKSLIKDMWKPIIMAGEKAYIIENGVAIIAPPQLVKNALAETPLGQFTASSENSDGSADQMNPLALMAAISNSRKDSLGGGPEITKEMRIESEAAGFVIGKHGAKVAEIRQISGAHVNISTEDETSDEGDRVIVLKGSPESVLLAQLLVQSNIDLFKKDRSMRGDFSMKEDDYSDHVQDANNRDQGFGRGGGQSVPYFSGARGQARGGGSGGNGGGMPYGRGGRRSPMDGRRGSSAGGIGRGKGRRR